MIIIYSNYVGAYVALAQASQQGTDVVDQIGQKGFGFRCKGGINSIVVMTS
jgi:hypothetical protein